MLRDKSIVELRGIAQSFGINDVFQKDKAQLLQAIEIRQDHIKPLPKIDIPKPEYDSRLMTKPPSKKSTTKEAESLLQPYIARGLRFEVDENNELWKMSFNKRNDEGTMRMPLRILLRCAKQLMI